MPKPSAPLPNRPCTTGLIILTLVNEAMVPAMDEVGRRFECNEYFVPELLLSARAMKAALELIRPLLAARGTEPLARIAIGTVKGDLHDIGKNLVAALLEGGGFEVIDLGVNVSPEEVHRYHQGKEREHHRHVRPADHDHARDEDDNRGLERSGRSGEVKILVGGAPITQKFADEIGADGFSDNAVGAVALAKKSIAS